MGKKRRTFKAIELTPLPRVSLAESRIDRDRAHGVLEGVVPVPVLQVRRGTVGVVDVIRTVGVNGLSVILDCGRDVTRLKGLVPGILESFRVFSVCHGCFDGCEDSERLEIAGRPAAQCRCDTTANITINPESGNSLPASSLASV